MTVLLLILSSALLIVGFMHSSVTFLCGAIGCAALAAVVLALVSRMARNRAVDATQPAAAEDNGPIHSLFPIANNDELRAVEMISFLDQVTPDELDGVEGREQAGEARLAVLNQIGRLRTPVPATPPPDSRVVSAAGTPKSSG